MTLEELRQKHGNAIKLGREIAEKATAEKRDITPEELKNAEQYLADADKYGNEVRVREGLERHATQLATSTGVSAAARVATDPATDPDGDTITVRSLRSRRLTRQREELAEISRRLPKDPEERKALANHSFAQWIRCEGQMTELEPEERACLALREFKNGEAEHWGDEKEQYFGRGLSRSEMRALGLSVGSDIAGGLIVPDMPQAQIVTAMKAFGGLMQAVHLEETSTGAPLPIPTNNDTANKGYRIAEGAARVTAANPTFGVVMLNAYLYTTGFIMASLEFLQDAKDVVGWLTGLIGVRLARGLNSELTLYNGQALPGMTGGSGPTGIVPAAVAAGAGITTASNAKITFDEAIGVKYALDPAYWPGARYMFNNTTLLQFKLIKDNQGRPLWMSGVATREPDMIDGDPYIINLDMPAIAPSSVPVIYGNLQNYWHRQVSGTSILVLRERFADQGQVAFLGFERHDGNLIDAGTHPVKCITMHS
jgi:HK97 family phage major capsid protein